ncbi:MAG: anti-sigma factor [Chloroflexia bacterium]
MDTSNVQDEGWEEQLIDYSLGVMEPGEAAEFELKLAECRQHVRLARQYEQAVSWMGMAAAPAEPPQGHQTRLMARIAETPQESATTPAMQGSPTVTESMRPTLSLVPPAMQAPPAATTNAPVVSLDEYRERRRNSLVTAIGAVAAALILVVGLWAFLGRGGGVDIPEGYQVVTLAPQAGNEGISAVALYHPDRTEAVLLADGMPTLPVGKVYEFWLMQDEGNPPVPAGVFTADNGGDGKHETKTPQKVSTYAGFAVSIEDAPGVDVPTQVIAVGLFATP